MSRPRVRNRISYGKTGVLTDGSGIYSESVWQSRNERCEDAVGGYQTANYLSIEKVLRTPIPMNGSYSYFGIDLTISDYADTRTANESAPHDLSGVPNNMLALGTSLLARSNPSKASIQLPVSLLEAFKDLPGMLKNAGDRILGAAKPGGSRPSGGNPVANAGSDYLAFQFGWLPLVRDVRTMLNLSGDIQKRMDAFDKIKEHGGLRRTIHLSDGKTYTESGVDLQTLLMVVGGTRHSSTKQQTWGSVRWIPNASFPKDKDKYRQMAIKAALGLSSNAWSVASNAWNSMPWTWLFDWFGNMGDFLEAHNGALPLACGQACIMQSVTTEVILVPISGTPDGVSGGGGRIVRTSKTRTPYIVPALTASLPLLSGRQLSILGALAAQRSR